MSFVLRPLYISFYATNVFKANGYKRIKYIVIFISCQLLSYYTEKSLFGVYFYFLSFITVCMTSTFFCCFFFFSPFHRFALVCLNSCSIGCRGHVDANKL